MPLERKPFCRKKNRIRQQKSKIQLAGGKIKKEKNKLEITENYSIGKENQKKVSNHRGVMSIVLLEKKGKQKRIRSHRGFD